MFILKSNEDVKVDIFYNSQPPAHQTIYSRYDCMQVAEVFPGQVKWLYCTLWKEIKTAYYINMALKQVEDILYYQFFARVTHTI